MATVTVTTLHGQLKGGEAVSENGRKYYEFLSVPYAQPPVGDLRFKNPLPLQPWEGQRDATKVDLLNISCQYNFMTKETSGSEDCLYLNVYTPQLPTPGTKPLPVMVYIHGGGFIVGNGIIKDEANPEMLIENDVIVVSINYRLSIFGFLSLDIIEAPGNMGLKDQVAALHWVQNNIAQFGGDKDNVTIFGVSAGSASVDFLLLSPLSKGLYHKAILQSGSAINNWAMNYQYKQLTQNLAEKLGYTGDKEDNRALHNFFMKISSTELAEAAYLVSETFPVKSIFFGFVPTIEKNFDGAFLTTHPYKLLKKGKFNKVSVIRGFCENEGSLMDILKPLAVKELMEHKKLLSFWSYKIYGYHQEKYNEKLKKAYLLKKFETEDEVAVAFFGDLQFTSGIWLSSVLAAKSRLHQYVYKFSYYGNMNMNKATFNWRLKKAGHADDLGYIFKSTLLQTAQPDDADILIRKRLTKMWTNFAKTGNPTPSGSDLPLNWPEFTAKKRAFLIMDRTFSIQEDYEPEKMAVFEKIYAKYEK